MEWVVVFSVAVFLIGIILIVRDATIFLSLRRSNLNVASPETKTEHTQKARWNQLVTFG
jgi:hypothetical protein